MGCWNGTCALSQLAIRYRDPVVLIPIQKNKHASLDATAFCYHNEMFSPISLPVFGEYNDYGGIQKVNDPNNLTFNHLMSLWKRGVLVADAEKMKKENPNSPINAEEFLNNYVSEGLFKETGFVIIHLHIFEKCLSTMKENFEIDMLTSIRSFVSMFDEFRVSNEQLNSTIEQLKKELYDEGSALDDVTYEKTYRTLQRAEFFHKGYGDIREAAQNNEYVDVYSSYRGNFYQTLKPLVHQLVVNQNTELEVLLSKLATIESFFALSRKSWMPQSGSGSQADCYVLQRALANAVLDICKERENIE